MRSTTAEVYARFAQTEARDISPVFFERASSIAAAEPATLVRGDLLDTIPTLVAKAPGGSRVVVFHSAVLVYLEPGRRATGTSGLGSRTVLPEHGKCSMAANSGVSPR